MRVIHPNKPWVTYRIECEDVVGRISSRRSVIILAREHRGSRISCLGRSSEREIAGA